ncbi:MAG: hypothetical protein LBP53_02055 [Candidatus Peribacteria bacterium]|nr:hypothetical protein [Candidatus Peribacteria bacterium]
MKFTIDNLSALSQEDKNLLFEVGQEHIENFNEIVPLSVEERFKPLIQHILTDTDIEIKVFDAPHIVRYITKMLNLSTEEVHALNEAIRTLNEKEKADF